MLLRRLLDPDETARRRRLRAQIVRRNRIRREVAQGLEPKWRRMPRTARTVHDYGWNPLEDGTAVVADQRRVENAGNALAFLVKASTPTDTYGTVVPARVHSPAVMEGIQQVPARFANRVTASADPVDARQHGASTGLGNTRSIGARPSPGGMAHGGDGQRARQYNERVRLRWQDVLQLMLIQRHEDVLRKDDNRPWRHERLGLLLFARKHYKRASEHLVKAIQLGGNVKSVCWRRLAQCHWFEYEASLDWDALWDAKAAFEQALTHLEMACNPYVLFEYARVLEALGSYDSALNACASLLATFPKFAWSATVKLRFVLLQRYQLLTYGEAIDAAEKERAVAKCLEITKALLLDKSTTEQQYALVLYTHVRLNELLYVTTLKRGEGPGTVAKAAKSGADVGTEELYKLAVATGFAQPGQVKSWKLWWLQCDTFLRWADRFQTMNETIAAADALARALELMETPPMVKVVGQVDKASGDGAVERKIALYTAMATNYYQGNQMERAIRAMETIFQLNPYLETVRQSLAAWFPAKWKDRLELEDASQVQIARVLRGLWGRASAHRRRRERERQLEAVYKANPYHPLHRRNVLRLLKAKYAPHFLAQDLAARRIQQAAQKYLSLARIRWAFAARRDKQIRDLRAKYSTRKYRYNRNVRFQLAQLVPGEFDARFRREEWAAQLAQRWFRGERVRKAYRAQRAAIRAERARQEQASSCIQRSYRHYRQRCDGLALMHADQLLFEAQRRLQQARERLALQLQRLYRQRKNRLVLTTRLELKRRARHKLYEVRSSSAARIQRRWRRCLARKRGTATRDSEAALLLAELRRGHERVLAEEAEAHRVAWEGSARKIQAAYRGKRVRASIVKISRQPVALAPSEIAQLLQEEKAPRVVVLTKLDTVQDKRALFDFPVVVLRPADAHASLPLAHVTAAIQHSSVLHTLVVDGGDWRSPRVETLVKSLQLSKTLKVFALGAVRTQGSGRSAQRRPSSPDVPEDAEESDDEDEESSEDDEHDGANDGDSDQDSPMRALYETLRTKTFLLEQLLLEGNDLFTKRGKRDAVWLARVLGDYFYGRYGKLRVLAAQRMELSDDAAVHFGDALAINTVLQRLNLSGNAIRDAGAEAIASRGLSANHALVYLNLADNSVGSAGARALFRALETTNRTLRTLILSNNMVMNDAVAALFKMLQENATVESVDLRGNLIHADHLREIEAAMRERAGTANEELRLFLARRRLSQLTQSGGKASGGIQSPLSPLRSTKGKRRGAAPPLSPKKWIQAHAVPAANALSLIQPPCVVFRQPDEMVARAAVYGSPLKATTNASSPSKKRQKPAHHVPSETRLPVLLVSPPKRSLRQDRRS